MPNPPKKPAAAATKKTAAKTKNPTTKELFARLDALEKSHAALREMMTSRMMTAAAAPELPDEINSKDDVQTVVIVITQNRTGTFGLTGDTNFEEDLDLTNQAVKGLYIPIRDAIRDRGRTIGGNFNSTKFASNDTIGEASEALADVIPGLS